MTFPQKHLAREEAAKDVVQQLECLLAPLQPQRGTVATVMVDIYTFLQTKYIYIYGSCNSDHYGYRPHSMHGF